MDETRLKLGKFEAPSNSSWSSQAGSLTPEEEEFKSNAERILKSHKRPETRKDCLDGSNAQRPCPWVSCKFHLAVETTEAGTVKTLDSWDDGRPTCVLDVVDQTGGITLDEIGRLMGVTRERVRQIELKTLVQIRKSKFDFDEPAAKSEPTFFVDQAL